ncbi:ABC transporter permease [Vibrio rarus]|uniref:ABC transporter permease n=1 Tax=Vibrio rarus TaxID=413403 RepID=UPI0021C3DBB0|nr:thiamine ABC transporter permease [Vibrio rarus]
MLRFFYGLVVLLCIVPTVPGILGVVSSSLSYVPPLGMMTPSLHGFEQVFNWHGVWRSIALTFFSAMASSYLACLISFAIVQACWNTSWWKKIEWSLSPLLSVPHVAFAIGFAFLFDPTGLGVRLFHAVFGYDLNQASAHQLAFLIHDPNALGLIVMLAIKEVPFLLLMSIPILRQLNIDKTQKISASMGYSRAHGWWKCIFTPWLIKLRFPMLAVLAYSLSVVDVALIVGPTNPPTFAVLVWQWFNEPDLSLLPRASAGAIVLFVIAGFIILFARVIEWLLTKKITSWQVAGRRGCALPGKSVFSAMLLLTAVMLPLMLLWSIAQRWRFPQLIPSRYSLQFWQYEWSSIVSTIEQSLSLALVSASIAVVLALIAHEYRIRYRWQVPGYIIAIPMLIPQLSILFGLQVTTLFIGGNAHWLWVCWAHMFFAFPFVYLAMDGPWRSYNEALSRVALSLGKTPLRVFIKVKGVQLFPAILFAWAVGISVSLSQYLPTLILGAGRISTLTTEAVALSSGFDRRVTAIYALWQALLPLVFFFIAILGSRVQTRRRRINYKRLQSDESVS